MHISRFSLHGAVAIAWFVACGSQPARLQPDRAGTNAAEAAGQGSGDSAAATALPKIACPQPTCAYHAGTHRYFTCLAGGDGVCFHYGAPCTPTDSCMIDVQQRRYRQCATVGEGMCTQWGAACAPASRCMFNFDDGQHHHCDEIADGACRRFGSLCAP